MQETATWDGRKWGQCGEDPGGAVYTRCPHTPIFLPKSKILPLAINLMPSKTARRGRGVEVGDPTAFISHLLTGKERECK